MTAEIKKWEEANEFFKNMQPGDKISVYGDTFLKPVQDEDFHRLEGCLVALSNGAIWHFSHIICPRTIRQLKAKVLAEGF